MEKENTMNVIKKERQSNFELLRILSMILITVYHIVLYSGVFDIGAYTDNKLLASFIYPFGKVGVGCFILLMGYFMVSTKFKTEKMLKIVLETIFYSFGLLIVWMIRMGYTFDLVENKRAFIMPTISYSYWFVSAYVFIYLISPLLNCILNNFSISQLRKIVIIGLIVICVPYCIIGTRWVAEDITYFVLLYLIGGYIKLSDFNFKKKSSSIIMVLLNIFFITALMIGTIIVNKKFNLEIDVLRFGYEYSIFVIMLSIGIFLTFKNLKVKNSKIINFIAKSSFAVYLFSDHPMYKKLMWNIDFKTKEYIFKPFYSFGFRILTALVIIYLVVIVIDTIRREVLEKNLFKIKLVKNLCSKLDNYIND